MQLNKMTSLGRLKYVEMKKQEDGWIP